MVQVRPLFFSPFYSAQHSSVLPPPPPMSHLDAAPRGLPQPRVWGCRHASHDGLAAVLHKIRCGSTHMRQQRDGCATLLAGSRSPAARNRRYASTAAGRSSALDEPPSMPMEAEMPRPATWRCTGQGGTEPASGDEAGLGTGACRGAATHLLVEHPVPGCVKRQVVETGIAGAASALPPLLSAIGAVSLGGTA